MDTSKKHTLKHGIRDGLIYGSGFALGLVIGSIGMFTFLISIGWLIT